MARNTGIRYSNLTYIMFVGSDDEIQIKLVEELLKSIQVNNYDISICGYNRIFLKKNINVKSELV